MTNADGTQTAKTLVADGDDLTITEISVKEDATNTTLPDGSKITGLSSVTKVVGSVTSTGVMADAVLVAESDSHRVNEFITFNKDGSWRSEEKGMRLAA